MVPRLGVLYLAKLDEGQPVEVLLLAQKSSTVTLDHPFPLCELRREFLELANHLVQFFHHILRATRRPECF